MLHVSLGAGIGGLILLVVVFIGYFLFELWKDKHQ